MEDWAEIRRLHRAEGVPIKAVARRLGVSRNTVRAALACDEPPKYSRAAKGSVVDRFESRIRGQLKDDPSMPATVIAERVGWTGSMTVLRDRVRQVRPEYKGVDPVDKVVYRPGEVAQCDLWFPAALVPAGGGQGQVFPVLVMTSCFSRMRAGVMIPSRRGGDILAGMWQVIERAGAVAKTLVWDREAAIGGNGKPTAEAQAFVGALSARLRLAPPRDPEFKGMVERNNRFLETSFLPGRVFVSPADFNAQLAAWMDGVANTGRVRSIRARPVDLWAQDKAAMTPLPPIGPRVGLANRVRLARDYHVRLDANDYSVDPRVIGRIVQVEADADIVQITCAGKLVGAHRRCWAGEQTITDPAHVAMAKQLRAAYWADQHAREQTRRHADGHPVRLRALADYDQLFNVDFDTDPDLKENQL